MPLPGIYCSSDPEQFFFFFFNLCQVSFFGEFPQVVSQRNNVAVPEGNKTLVHVFESLYEYFWDLC